MGSAVPAPAELGTFEVQRVSGEGDDVVELDCSPAPCLIDVSHEGEGDFALATCDAAGRRRAMLAISTGPYEGRVTTYGDERAAATLEVTADGAWELTVRPMEAVERVELGEAGEAVAFHGDDVVYVDDASVVAIALAHRDEGRLAVRAVSVTGTEVLVDATGAFEDTLAWGKPRAYLVVSADGDWSMSRA